MPYYAHLGNLLATTFLVISLLGTNWDAQGAALSVEIRGDLEGSYYDKNGRFETSFNSDFRAVLQGCNVMIRTRGFASPDLDYFEFGTDGTNSYNLQKFHKIAATNAAKAIGSHVEIVPLKAPKFPVNEGSVDIHNGITPSMRGMISPVYLAYGSGCLLAKKTPGDFIDDAVEVFDPIRRTAKQKAIWEWADTNQLFVKEFIGFRSETRRNPGNASAAETTNAIFRVTQWTNTSGIALPAQFELTFYIPGPTAPTLSARIVGYAKEFDTHLKNDLVGMRTEFDFPVYVGDYRVSVEGRKAPVTYVGKDGKLKSIEEASIVASVLDSHPSTKRSLVPKTSPLMLFVSLISLISIGFLTILYVKKRCASENNQPKER